MGYQQAVTLNQISYLSPHQDGSPLDTTVPSRWKTLEATLRPLFRGEEEDDGRLAKARAVLRETAQDLSDEELVSHLTQFQYLLEEWLDLYEQKLFNGITLQQLLRER